MSTLSAATDAAARPLRPARPVGRPARVPLARPRTMAVTGVAAGLADHVGVSVTRVRLLLTVAAVLGGAGLLFYVWCWLFMPLRAGDRATERRVPVAWLLLTGAGIAAIGLLFVAQTSVDLDLNVFFRETAGDALRFWPTVPWAWATTLLATAAGVWAGSIDRVDPSRGPRHALIVRVLAAVALAAVFVAVAGTADVRGGRAVIGELVLPVVGVAAIAASALLQAWRHLVDERIGRVRDEQRSAMAAHLHDSVLQTLALIQNRSGASSEVSRIARAQERELRAWLYDGDSPADSDLPTDLRDYAGALELDFPVRIEVVSTGTSTERASGELAAAAREAMLNAARHAGGEISVYIEGAASAVDVFIRDRGDGFDPAAVPADRWGVRESIVGRMRRAGGTAVIRSVPDVTGTEVRLSLPTTGARRD
ncbi:ATP-binding protein [Microbacterium oleivorans]|uniref:ATP-binding protein n=1 Tax=Microbacterium oleivorans TaxID=273677 RepID=UPI0010A3926F|nr:ATP-binding protein [Microbacterium oleivorans]THE06383.1 ATP-binding protein [Microbacterium oleivorans]